MSEKRYFKHLSPHIQAVYAFPAKIKVYKGITIFEISNLNVKIEHFENDKDYAEITEAEFLEVFHEVQNEITLSYHRQFAKENEFVKNESLKSEGY